MPKHHPFDLNLGDNFWMLNANPTKHVEVRLLIGSLMQTLIFLQGPTSFKNKHHKTKKEKQKRNKVGLIEKKPFPNPFHPQLK